MNLEQLAKRIPLEGTINTRSLEGYETIDHRHIKKNRILRSDCLKSITENDKKVLHEVYDLRLDVDLRGDGEIAFAPDLPVPGCRFLHCPIEEDLNKALPNPYPHQDYHIQDPAIAGTVEYLFRLDPRGDATHAFETIYQNFVSNPYSYTHYGILMRELLNNKEGSALFHCADGKDRCGTGVALFLSILGVPRDVIFYDYLKTNEYTKGKADAREKYLREVAHVTDEVVIESIRIVAGVRKNFLEAAFEAIDTKFGGIDAYIHNQLGFTDEMIEEMKDNYLE